MHPFIQINNGIIQPVIIVATVSPETSARSLKDMYLRNLDQRRNEVWTKLKVSYVIDYMQDPIGKKAPDYCNLSNFNITTKDNITVLNRLTHDYGFVNQLKFVPCMEAFDIIWEAHIADNVHRTLTETMRIIQIEHYIELSNVKAVLNLCSLCKDRGEQLRSLNKQCSVSIVIMTDLPDQDFKFILVYEDLATGLIQLRPLVTLCDKDVCMELFTIFADLGTPKELFVSEQSFFLDPFVKLLNKCTTLLSSREITVIYRRSSNRWMRHIRVLMDKLMFYMNVTNWAMLCYTLQWRINITKFCDETPHNLTFNNNFYSNKHTTNPTMPKNIAEITNYFNRDPDSEEECSSLSSLDSEVEILDERRNLIILDARNENISKTKNLQKCQECGKLIVTKCYTCKKCNRYLHLFCGERVLSTDSNLVIIVCKTCRDS